MMIDASGKQLKRLLSVENSQFLEGRECILMSFQWAQRRFFNAFLQFLKAKVKSFSNTCQFQHTRSEIQCELKKKKQPFTLNIRTQRKSIENEKGQKNSHAIKLCAVKRPTSSGKKSFQLQTTQRIVPAFKSLKTAPKQAESVFFLNKDLSAAAVMERKQIISRFVCSCLTSEGRFHLGPV